MTTTISDNVHDNGLAYLRTNCDKVTICSQAPATYAEGNATHALADVAVSSADFTLAAGDTSGRKLTFDGKSGALIDATGNGNHLAFLYTGNTELLYVTPIEEAASGTAQAGGASTITLASGASAVDGFFNGYAIILTGGTGEGQTRYITDYVGSTKVATVGSAWSTQPDSTTEYKIYGVYLTANGSNTVDFGACDLESRAPVLET